MEYSKYSWTGKEVIQESNLDIQWVFECEWIILLVEKFEKSMCVKAEINMDCDILGEGDRHYF